jgi:hypothetical protein
MGPEMCNAACHGEDGTQCRIARPTESDDLTPDAVLLSGECERYECDAREIVDGYGRGQKPLLSNPALNVLEREGSGI